MTKRLISLLPCLALLCSCTENYLIYDTSYKGIYFTKDTLEYSFGVTPVDIRTKEFQIPVRVLGELSGEDRTFTFEVVADKTTATEGTHYTIGKPVVPADSVNGYIPVTFHRDNLEGDYINGFVYYKLTVRLTSNNFFTPTLDSLAQTRTITFDNAVEQPAWYNYKGEKVWYESQWGVWHPLKLIKMVEFYHTIADYQPETYKKMVETYGENLENVPYADFHVYKSTMIKYVFGPMYDYFSNPDNREEILSLYADFPFDFPNPYGGW